MRPRIGSHHSLQDPRLWSFERRSGLSRDAFEQHDNKADRLVLILCTGILGGVVAALIGNWLG
jgi:hypothetical protein